MEVVKEFDNKLLKRKELIGKVPLGSSPIPSRVQVKKDLAKKLSVDESLIVIKKIDAGYGALDVKIEANIYEDVSLIPKIETGYIVKRNEMPAPEEKVEEETSSVEETKKEEETKEE